MRRLGTFCILCILLTLVACNKNAPAPNVDGGKGNSGGGDSKPKVDYQARFDQLMTELKHKAPGRRGNAIAGIVEFKEEAIPYLIQALSDNGVSDVPSYPGLPASTREAAVIALLRIGPAGEKALLGDGLTILIGGLLDPEPAVVEHTITAIGLIGPKAKEAAGDIAKHCSSDNDGVRRAAYDALDSIKTIPVNVIVPLLTSPEPKVAADAARAVSAIRPLPKEVIPTLIAQLKVNPSALPEAPEYAYVRNEIADALASFGDLAKEAIPVLIEVVRNTTDPEFARFYRPIVGRDSRGDELPAMVALRRIGKAAVPKVVELLESDTALVRWQAARILAGIGPDAKEALPALDRSFDKELRLPMRDFNVIAATALALVQLGAEPMKPVGELAKLLMEKEPMVRLETLRELARFSRKGESAVMAIIPMLDDPNGEIRVQAADTLRAIGPAAKAAIPALTKKLADMQLLVRRNALQTLRSFGPLAAETIPEITKLLADQDDAFRREVVEVVIAIGPAAKATVPDLAKLLKSPDERELMLVLEALAAIGREARPAVADILPVLENRDRDIRAQALNALGRIGDATPEIVKAITNRLRDDFTSVRLAAVRALALLGPGAKEAVPALVAFGHPKRPDPAAAVWASTALYRIGSDADANLQMVIAALRNKELAGRLARLEAMDAAEYLGPAAKVVIPDLIEALGDNTPIRVNDKTPVRLRAIVAIGKMGPAAKDAVPRLSNMLKETDATIKHAALDALGQIGPAAAFALPRLREIIRLDPAFAEQAQEVLDRIEKK